MRATPMCMHARVARRTHALTSHARSHTCVDHVTKQLQQLSDGGVFSEENENMSDSDEDGSESEEDVEDEGDEDMSIEQIRNSTVVMLKKELHRLGLSKNGRKHTLVKRLVDHHGFD